LAISAPPKQKVLAVGAQAKSTAIAASAKVVNPFAHPRSLVSDFTVAEQLIRHQLQSLQSKSFLSPSPCVVMHPLGTPEGGFTQIERRAFREMALGAGASEVFVWTGRLLTDEEILLKHPPLGGEWE